MSSNNSCSTPRKQILKSKLRKIRSSIKKRDSTLKRERERLRRTKIKITNLTNCLDILKQKNLINDECSTFLNKKYGQLQKSLVSRLINRNISSYDETIKQFVIELDYLSPKGYDMIRAAFDNNLPSRSTISKWYAKLPTGCGFHEEVFLAIKEYSNICSELLVTNVVWDEIHLKSEEYCDGKRMHGYTDYGLGANEGDVASKALVFMLIFINRPIKIPLGYFFTSTLSRYQIKNLKDSCFSKVKETGVFILGAGFDCASNNLGAMNLSGASLQPPHLESVFEHDGDCHIAHPDISHVLKNIRNHHAMHDMIDNSGGLISFAYLKKLNELQEEIGFHFANKINKNHINFNGCKMKVKYASQLFSLSVANALKFLREVVKHKDFLGSESTEKFVRMMNDLFDILNSRHGNSGLKAPLSLENSKSVLQFSEEGIEYISTLKIIPKSEDCEVTTEIKPTKDFVIQQSWGVAFYAMILCLKNLNFIVENFLETGLLQECPMYRLTTDHIEQFFSCIRMKLGCNNNPTCFQFESSYKRCSSIRTIKGLKTGNTVSLENIYFLTSKSISICQKKSLVQLINSSTKKNLLINESQDLKDVNENSLSTDDNFELFMKCQDEGTNGSNAVIRYIAGFVTKKLQRLLKCSECHQLLTANSIKCSFYEFKTRNRGLKIPSQTTMAICFLTEKNVKFLQEENEAFSEKNFTKIVISVASEFQFNKLMFEHSGMNFHGVWLLKVVIETYLKIRFKYLSRSQSRKTATIRPKLAKTIIFVESNAKKKIGSKVI